MPQIIFALEDWYQLPISGHFEYYCRPGQPYTIVINTENGKNNVALINGTSYNSAWYFEQYMSLPNEQIFSLNQDNLLYVEMLALLSEDYTGHHPHFYLDLQEVAELESWRYTAFFEVSWLNDRNIVQFGWLGIRNQDEYRQILNAMPYLSYPETSREHQKARNIIISFTGVVALSVTDFELSQIGTGNTFS